MIIKGILLLLATLIGFSLFTLKMPKGQQAMQGLANAAVASFLVEAIHLFVTGDMLGLGFLKNVGLASGSLSGVSAVILVGISMGINPIYAVSAGLALKGFGILPGFISGYSIGLLAPYVEKYLPSGIDIILGVLVIAPAARLIGMVSDPLVSQILGTIGQTVAIGAEQSPLVMGLFLGGMMKMICTSPLSSMALTAMLGLQGLAMGIASIACVGGAITNGIVFKRLGLGNKGNVIAVILEPLTQADLVTANALPIYSTNFFGGALSGIVAASLGIINNAPGTASPIPGLLAPLGFNPPAKVLLAVGLSMICGYIVGEIGSKIILSLRKNKVALIA